MTGSITLMARMPYSGVHGPVNSNYIFPHGSSWGLPELLPRMKITLQDKLQSKSSVHEALYPLDVFAAWQQNKIYLLLSKFMEVLDGQ